MLRNNHMLRICFSIAISKWNILFSLGSGCVDGKVKKYSLKMALSLAIFLMVIAGFGVLQASPEERQVLVAAFVEEMVTKNGFERIMIESIMYQARFRQSIIDAMERPAEAKPWYEYREIFLTPARIEGGVKFWHDNKAELTDVAKKYGVPPEIIVAIIGVETNYGYNMGRYRVIDALSTLAFGYPKRAKYFRQELEEFLLLSKEDGIDVRTRVGSYAGAMGLPQFMPSSYRKYAQDGDLDGRRDLWNSNADVIASVANYFRGNGWYADEPVVLKINGSVANQALVSKGNKPNPPRLPITIITEQRIITTPPLNSTRMNRNALINLISLEGEGGNEYWVGLRNFYAITRYNHSNHYAMAVYQLSQEILTVLAATK